MRNHPPLRRCPLCRETYQPVPRSPFPLTGHRLALGYGRALGFIPLTDTNQSVCIAQVSSPEDAVQSCPVRDGRRVPPEDSAASASGRATPWPHGTWTNGMAGRITAMEFAPDGAMLAIAESGNGQRVTVLTTTNSDPVVSWRAHRDTTCTISNS